MKYLCLLVVLMVAAGASFGQTVTPLHAILNSNSLLDRPYNFRLMQEKLRNLNQKTQPGAKLEYFTSKFGQMREEIMSLLVAPQLEIHFQPDSTRQRADRWRDTLRLQADTLRLQADTLRLQVETLHVTPVDSNRIADSLRNIAERRDKEVGILWIKADSLSSRADSIGAKTDTLVLIWRSTVKRHPFREPNSSRTDEVDSIKAFLKDDLRASVRQGFQNAFAKSKLSSQEETILQTLLDRLKSLGVASHCKGDKLEDRIADAIAEYLVSEMSILLDIEKYDWDNLDQHVDPLTALQRAVALLNAGAKEVTQDIRTKVSEALNTAETTVEGAYSQLSNRLISANTGLAATSGEGDLSGGVMVSWVMNQTVQLGFFVSGQIGIQDTSRGNLDTSRGSSSSSNEQVDTLITPVRALWGVRIQVAVDPCGMDLIVSKMIGEDLADTWEFGAGLSVRIDPSIVLGVAYVYQYEDLGHVNGELIKHRNHHLFGLNLKGASSDSPAVLIAMSKSEADEHLTPTLQVSFPFNVQR